MEEALFKVLSFITFIMLGYLLRRLSILKAETFRVLSGIVFYITLPCIIITSINGVRRARTASPCAFSTW